MAHKLRAPDSIAATDRAKIAGSGCLRPWAERGSGTLAKASNKLRPSTCSSIPLHYHNNSATIKKPFGYGYLSYAFVPKYPIEAWATVDRLNDFPYHTHLPPVLRDYSQ